MQNCRFYFRVPSLRIFKGYRQISKGFILQFPPPVLIWELNSPRRVVFTTVSSLDWSLFYSTNILSYVYDSRLISHFFYTFDKRLCLTNETLSNGLHNSNSFIQGQVSRGWGIHWLHHCGGMIPPNKCSGYDTKQSDGEALVMLELWGMQSTPLLPSLPGPLLPGMVAPDRVLSMRQMEPNSVLMLNWIVWN